MASSQMPLSVPALGTDDLQFLTVVDGDIIAQKMAECNVVAIM